MELHPEIRDAFGSQARVEMLHRFLRTHAAFEDLSLEAASEIYPRLRPLEVPAETVLVREGEPGGTMYLIEQGRLEATTANGDVEKSIGFMRTGDIFGERSLVTGEACVATVPRGHPSAPPRTRPRGVPRLGEPVPRLLARRVNEQAAGRNFQEEHAFRSTSPRKSCPAASAKSAPRVRLQGKCRLRSRNASAEVGGRRSSPSSSRSMRRTVVSLAWP